MAYDRRSEYLLQVDYQHIFNPVLASVIDIQYKPLVDKAEHYNTNVINNWINSHEKK
jgi:hypothetical protein